MQEDNTTFWACIITCIGSVFICLLVSILSIACNHGPKTYEFQYSVDVRYTDNSRETLVGTHVITTSEPKKVKFTMSSRLRMTPCLTLGKEGMNIACDVKSFTVRVLKHIEIE